MTAGCKIALHERHCEIPMPPAQQMAERFSRALQVISCEQARISLDEVFGPNAKGFIASLNTEGHHRGAVAAVKSQQLKEVRSFRQKGDACPSPLALVNRTLNWK